MAFAARAAPQASGGVNVTGCLRLGVFRRSANAISVTVAAAVDGSEAALRLAN